MMPNPPINRNCNSPLRGLPQSGYWQRYAAPTAIFACSQALALSAGLWLTE